MRVIIYALLTIFYVILIIAGMAKGISWFTMFWLIYGVVLFGSKFMKLLEEKGLWRKSEALILPRKNHTI